MNESLIKELVDDAVAARVESRRLRKLLQEVLPHMKGTWTTRAGSRCVCRGCEEIRDLHARIQAAINDPDVERIAQIVDPPAWGLPDPITQEDSLSDRDEARFRARQIVKFISPSAGPPAGSES